MNKPNIYQIKGMHCASCANIIERTFKKSEGVESVEVNYGTETTKIVFDKSKTNPEILSKKIEPLGYSLVLDEDKHVMNHSKQSASEMGMSEEEHLLHTGLSQSKKDKIIEIDEMKSKLITLIPIVVISIFVMGWDIFSQLNFLPKMTYLWSEFFHHLLPVFATYTLFVVGKPYLLGLYRFIRFGKANMDTLIGLGTSVAFAFSFIVSAFEESLRNFINVEHTYYDVVIVVIAFITLGKYLESKSKLKTGDAIEKLLNLQAKTALVLRDNIEVEIPVSKVVHGDKIIIKPAGKIPVDGTIIEGASYVDESMITGEPMPVSKKVGENVVAGTINTTGSFIISATKVGSETMLAHIVEMVRQAQGSRAPIQNLADKISSIFVPVVLGIAFVTLISWLLIGTQYLGFSQALSFGLVSFVGILVIACPCALGLATPTAIIVGVGKGAREGILIKDASTLEKLHKVNTVVVDKTGTITKGKPELTSLKNYSRLEEAKVLSIFYGLENKSEHPVAHAIIGYTKQKHIEPATVSRFEIIKGKGIKGTVEGIEYFVGNTKMISDLKISFDTKSLEEETLEGKTPIILATKNEVISVVMVSDAIKPEAIKAVQDLHKLGIRVVMLTGDNQNTAEVIARKVGIDEVIAEVLPEDKFNKVKEFQSRGEIVAMAGDGVNDAPALAIADVGIAMATGTDVAIESAGITLLSGDISKLVKAIHLSKITMIGIKQNLFWAFIYNIVGIPLASGIFFPIFGWLLSPVFAGFAMAMSSVSVVGNSLRIKSKKI